MGKKIIPYLILIPILLLGVITYFYKLGSIPNGIYIDEALPAYNAYSLLKTGKDEYGKLFPLALRFYGSYNPFLYTYLSIIPISLLGLTNFASRFVSALSGLLLIVPLIIFLKQFKFRSQLTFYIGTLLLVICPWLILHSRVGYEVTLGLLLYSLGVIFFWLVVKEKKYLIPGIIFLSLSTYAAYTERFLAPIFLICYHFFIKRVSWKIILLSVIFQIPNFYLLVQGAFFPKGDLFWSGSGNILKQFLSQYVTYFSPRSLFFLPDSDIQRSIPELSVFYFWMIVPYSVGLFKLWFERKDKLYKFLIILLLISPIPAAFTKDPFATHRAIPAVFPLLVVMTLGMDVVLSKVSKLLSIPSLGLLLGLTLILLWRSYFVLLPSERASVWGYGFEELAEIIEENKKTNFVIDQTRIKPAYIYLAYYLKYDPARFQLETEKQIKNNYYKVMPFNNHYVFANIETRNIDWKKDPCTKAILVGDELTFSELQAKEHFLEKIFEIKDPIDFVVFRGYKTNPEKKCKI